MSDMSVATNRLPIRNKSDARVRFKAARDNYTLAITLAGRDSPITLRHKQYLTEVAATFAQYVEEDAYSSN